MIRFGSLLLTSLLASNVAMAEEETSNKNNTDAQSEEKKAIEGEFELGFISTTGNTETSSLKSKLAVIHDLDHWRNNYQFSSFYKDETVEENGVETTEVSAEKYFASVQGDYKLINNGSALFLYASYEDDRFSGYNYQQSYALGYSNQVLNNKVHKLNYNVGPGYSFSELNDGDTEEGGFLRLAVDYRYRISENARFTQKISTQAAFESDDNTKSKSETGLAATLIGNLSIKAAITVDHNTNVPDDTEKTDTETSLSILYLF
ncbi:DUF481 domain-containing protein [Bermanella marisrubri]|uniref:Putative orphan protein n=1 Tax=Bermanella marisrubri TaxID=207949 RepID=Q1MZE3_9GAMM|nr:DUF481 domain-containing protein [Bermanella marisrubri]EAT11323.1 putative orphan protein [Oceanobacter sp. RED65] [Bermanella marisrubri]